MEWKEVILDDLIEDISMGPFGSDIKRECYVSEGIPYLNGSNVQGVKLGEDSFIYVPVEKAEKLKKALAHRGDIIVTHRGTIGQIVFVPNNSKYKEYLISNSQFRVTLRKEIVDSEFLTYFFHSKRGQYILLSNASQVGVPALARPTSSFRKLKIVIPSLPTQRRIANILSSLDRKIELNNQINKQLEEMAQAIFKSWFIDFEPFKDGEFVDSELGRIPKGWRVGTLGKIGDIVGGGTPSKAVAEYYCELGIPWLTPKDLSNRNNKFTSRGETDITQLGYDNSSAKLMPKGSVLFSSRAPIGYITIAQNEICTNQGFKSVVPKQAGTAFIYYYLKNATPEIENQATGSTFKEASGSLMKSLKLVVPTNKVLDSFEETMKPFFNRQENLEAENSHLSSLRDTLLPKLMSGEINLEQYGNQ